jgi:hypothetical protein
MLARGVVMLVLLMGCTKSGGDPDAKPASRSARSDEKGGEGDVRSAQLESGTQAGQGDAPEDAAEPMRPWPADAPARDSTCESNRDCAVMIWDGPMPPDPCCDERVGFMAVHVSYLEFFRQYRAEHCKGAQCPPNAFPGAEPACCVEIPRCFEGACVTACDDPSAKVPAVSRLDSECSLHRISPTESEGP